MVLPIRLFWDPVGVSRTSGEKLKDLGKYIIEDAETIGT
jgi:hypothetical protein